MMFWNRNNEVKEVKENDIERFIEEQERLNENLRRLNKEFAKQNSEFNNWYKRELAKAAR